MYRSYTAQTDGSWIEDKEFAIVWHYEQADPEYGKMQAADLQKYLIKVIGNPNVDILRYDRSKILELKPHGVSKGLAATAIMESLWIREERKRALSSSSSSSTPPFDANNPPLSPRTVSTANFRPFVLSIGDDRSDEEMFIAIQCKSFLDGRIRGHKSEFHHASTRSISTVSHDEHTPTNAQRTPAQAAASSASRNTPSSDPHVFTVCIGANKSSSARYYLSSVDECLQTLTAMVLEDKEQANPGAEIAKMTTMGLQKRLSKSNAVGVSGVEEKKSSQMGGKKGSWANLTAMFNSATKSD